MKNWIIGIVVLVLIIIGFLSINGKKETGPIKIGVIAPLTGDAAVYGEEALNVYKLAVKEINDTGGVNGRMLELIPEDGKCNGKDAASSAQKLVNIDKVQVIIGGFCSGEALAALPIAEQAKVMLFSASASSPDLTGKSQYFARNYPGDTTQGKVLAEVANKRGFKNVYIISEQTEYSQGIAKSFTTAFEVYGGKVVNEAFSSEVSDLRQFVTKAKNANPDALFIISQPGNDQKLLKAINDLQWKPNLFVNDTIAGNKEVLSKFKSLLEGAHLAEFGFDPNNSILKKLLESYKFTYNKDVTLPSYVQTEYDAVYMLRDGIKTVGYNGEKLSNWIRTVKDWKGAAGMVSIGSDGDPLVGHRAEIIRNGKAEVYNQ